MVEENDARNLDAKTVYKVPKILTVSPMAEENAVRNRDARMGHMWQDIVVCMVENHVRNRAAQLLQPVKPTIV